MSKFDEDLLKRAETLNMKLFVQNNNLILLINMKLIVNRKIVIFVHSYKCDLVHLIKYALWAGK